MKTNELRGIFIFLVMICVTEVTVLLSIVFFSQLPFFLALFTTAIRMLAFLLSLLIMGFLVYILLASRPELTIEWWIENIKEYLRSLVGSMLATAVLLVLSISIGSGLAILTSGLFSSSPMQAAQEWVNRHII